MTSNQNDLFLSVIITICSAGLGLKLGSSIGEYLDAQAIAESGRSIRSYHYWDIRLGISGSIIGLILGAIGAYIYALFQKNK